MAFASSDVLHFRLNQAVHVRPQRCLAHRRYSAQTPTYNSRLETHSGQASSGGKGETRYSPVVIVGAGAAGIGVAHSMSRATLLGPNIRIIERGEKVGSSFREWHSTTRFISPSFASYPFGPQDLNAIVPDTAIHATLNGGQHPTGEEYANYLERMMTGIDVKVEFNTSVTKVQHRPAQGGKDDLIVLHTSNGNIIVCSYLVWAAGDWSNPIQLPSSKFSTEATVLYKDANVYDLVQSVQNTNEAIILVGFGEAGADLASALVSKGARRIIILEKQELDTVQNLDPSRRLSPITVSRLSHISQYVDIRWASKAVGVVKDGNKNKVVINNSNGETTYITSPARVVLCTGFNVSTSELWQSMFNFRNRSPQVNEFDESTKIPNLFLAGPMLYHTLTPCQEDVQQTKNGTTSKVDGSGTALGDEQDWETPSCDTGDGVIFCFIYKFRTRFAVVAGEIIRRIARVKCMDEQGKMSDQGRDVMRSVQRMQEFYRSKGMLVTDLTCSTLACGMSTQDTPVYNFDSANKDECCETGAIDCC